MKKICTLLLIAVLGSAQVFGQTQDRIDSLSRVLGTVEDPPERYRILNLLWYVTIDNEIEQAIAYAEDMIRLGAESGIDTIFTYGLERKAVAYAYMNQFDSSGVYFKQALEIYSQNGNWKGMAGVQRNLGQDLNMVGDLDEAFRYYEMAEANYEKARDSIGLGSIYNSKAIVFLQKGFYNLALEEAFSSADISRSYRDSIELVQDQMVIASIYGEMRDTLNALAYHEKALVFFERIQELRQQGVILILMAQLGINQSELQEKTQARFQRAKEIVLKLKEPSLRYQVEHLQSLLWFRQGKVNAAIDALSSLVGLEEVQKNFLGAAEYHIDLGRMYLSQKQYKAAGVQLLTGLRRAEESANPTLEIMAHRLLAELNESTGQFEQAFRHQKRFQILNDSLNNSESQKRFAELQTIYETEKKEAEIALQKEQIRTLYEQAKVDRLTKGIYGGGLVSVLAISILLVMWYRQRLRRNLIEQEKQEEIFRKEIEYKRKELASQTLHLVQKGTFIQELEESLSKVKDSSELRRIILLLRKENALDKDWELFKNYFAEVHNDFDQKLLSYHPDITEKEIRLAAFLRMNLTTKEIATTMNVLPDSILKSKYRLKKKLGLDSRMDLKGFLDGL